MTGPVNYRPCCQHCGNPLTAGGTAILCGPGGGRMKLPDYCADAACRRARDDAAIARGVAAGLIAP